MRSSQVYARSEKAEEFAQEMFPRPQTSALDTLRRQFERERTIGLSFTSKRLGTIVNEVNSGNSAGAG
jgi:hypothetical protein